MAGYVGRTIGFAAAFNPANCRICFQPSPDLADDPADPRCWFDRMDDWDATCGRLRDELYRANHQVWDVSAACLRHLAGRLAAALPVTHRRLDPELLPGGAAFRGYL